MKTMYKFLTLLLIATSITIVSCDKDEPVVQPVNYQVKVVFNKDFENKIAPNTKVVLSSASSEKKYEALTDAKGAVTFNNIIPDTYNITATLKLSKANFEKLFGYAPDKEEINFGATENKIVINKQTEPSKTLTLLTAKIGDLVFKQIYYAGSDVRQGAVYRDLFFEVYNNSNETIYLDGLYFGQAFGRTKSTQESYTISDGQYDWSKSKGQTKGNKSNTDFVYVDHIYQIPGTGKQYALKPGESAVVAQNAINHKEPLVVQVNGKDRTYSVKNPALTIDLSNATFEVNMIEYFTALGKKPLATDVDNPNVPNLNIIYNLNLKDLILDPLGRDSFIIFRTKELATYSKLPNPQTTTVTSRTKLFMQIPNEVIIDAVETNKEDPSKLYPRRLSASLDAGYAFVPKGKYSSQSIIRKVVKEVNGRKILQDTNNSTNDFEILDLPKPFGWK